MEKTIKIESFDVEFISRKMNDYKQMMFYFKLVDKDLKKKLKPLRKLTDCLLPFWETDKGEYLIKVKEQHVSHPQPNKNELYHARLEFKLFDFTVSGGNKGYFVKISNLGDPNSRDLVVDDSD